MERMEKIVQYKQILFVKQQVGVIGVLVVQVVMKVCVLELDYFIMLNMNK